IAFLLFLLPAYSYSSSLGTLRISLVEGDVQLKNDDTTEWIPVAINMPISSGDRIWVPESGRLEIQLADGSFLRLDEESLIVTKRAEAEAARFYLGKGNAYINFRGGSYGAIRIDTPVASVSTDYRSKFGIEAKEYDITEISVYRGSVYAETEYNRTRVGAGDTLSLIEGNYADISPLGPAGGWESWNRERDRIFDESRYSQRYLPAELRPYSYDFDNYGRWVYAREYGYVWTPTVVADAGWSPYRSGRWSWIGGDYVWVAYEPWGWAPYHYGRWTFSVSIGWFWVPPGSGQVYWGPGFVGLVYTPTYVAWVPLAPREIYYGYGYYGPWSVNIININIQNTVIKTVYRNTYARNAVNVQHHDAFINGRHAKLSGVKNPFIDKKHPAGRPEIRPRKASFKPVGRDVQDVNQHHRAGGKHVDTGERRSSLREKYQFIYTREAEARVDSGKRRPSLREKSQSVYTRKAEAPERSLNARHAKNPSRGKAAMKSPRKTLPVWKIQPYKKSPTEVNSTLNRKRLSGRSVVAKKITGSADMSYSSGKTYRNKQIRHVRTDQDKKRHGTEIVKSMTTERKEVMVPGRAKDHDSQKNIFRRFSRTVK
ncbi:MAG: FecR family protein, partial [Nitrospirota bacterium]|nr:FecR family protein [Nitrospirota bacterium]